MDAATSAYVIICKDIIKPSSSTPPHLKSLKLSLLDQLAPPVYIPLIFFYLPNNKTGLTLTNHAQISQMLNQSLSDTLTLFYPLAGKLDHDKFTVDCNDYGVEFTEARVHAVLSNVIKNPSMEQLKSFLPVIGEVPDFLLAVHASFFECGGIAIGVCVSHQIADGASAMALLNAWGSICRGDQPKSPVFGLLARHFPTNELIDPSATLSALLETKEKLAAKRFLFDKEKLAALKRAAACSPNDVKDPTRVELVSAFIWKHLAGTERNDTLVATHAINLRPRASKNTLCDDNLAFENVFGNCYFLSSAFYGGAFDRYEGKSVPELDQLVSKLRQAIRRIDDEYIRKTQSESSTYLGDLSKCLDLQLQGGTKYCAFSSWCRFSMYEVDYGWGTPEWLALRHFPL